MASGAAPAEVFAAIAREVAHMLHPRLVQIFRWDTDGRVTVAGTWGDGPNPFEQGSSWAWDDPSLVAMLEDLRTGRPIRIEDVGRAIAGEPVEAGLRAGIGSAAGAAIILEGEPWGHIGIAMAKGAPLPDRVEERLAEITELVATAITSSTNREQLVRLADEQAALRRVATLVARGAPPADVFDAVAEELGRLLDVASSGLVRYEDAETARVVAGWGRLGEVVPVGARLPIGGENVITEIARTGRPARLDDYGRASSGSIGEHAQRLKTETSIGGPVLVAGRLWGAMIAATVEGRSLPSDSERRLQQFVELVGTAIANTEAQVEVARLAEEQAALRRVATLVARGAPPGEVFRAVAEELGQLLAVNSSGLVRFEHPDAARLIAGWGRITEVVADGERFPLGGRNALTEIARTGEPARVDDYGRDASGAIGERSQQVDIETSIGAPIVVAGRLWGAMIASTRGRRLAAREHRPPARAVLRPRRHRDRQRGGARPDRLPRRRAGRAAAGGDARGRGGAGRGAVPQGRRGGGGPARRGGRVGDPPLRGRRHRDGARGLVGTRARRDRRGRAAAARRQQRDRAGVPREARRAR